jgi:hypothetical protein
MTSETVNECNGDVSTVALIVSRFNATLPPSSGTARSSPEESLSAFDDLPEMVGIVAIFSREVRYCDSLRSTQRSSRLASLLWAVGVVTFLLSVASPYDDAFQQELFRPKSVAVRRLPSAITVTRNIGAVTQISAVAGANASAMPVVLRDVEPDTAIPLAIRFRYSLALRSPPPIR